MGGTPTTIDNQNLMANTGPMQWAVFNDTEVDDEYYVRKIYAWMLLSDSTGAVISLLAVVQADGGDMSVVTTAFDSNYFIGFCEDRSRKRLEAQLPRARRDRRRWG